METVARFGAVGDIVLSGRTAEAMDRHGLAWPFELVGEVLGSADVLFGNLECVLLPEGFPPHERDPRGLTTTIDGATALAKAGFDVVNLANNHILDGGTVGLEHTAAALGRAGLVTAGVGATQAEARRPALLERAGLRWAFLCYAEDSNYTLSTSGPCFAYYEPDQVVEDVRAVRDAADVVVVSIHADLEFTATPSPARRDAFRRIARAGATLVLGHHPHVAQGMERVGDAVVVHSLGNFVSHAHSSPYLSPRLPMTAETFVLIAEVSAGRVGAVSRVPVVIGRPPEERPAVAVGPESEAIRARLEWLDHALSDDAQVAGNWRAIALERARAASGRLAAARDEEEFVHALGTLLHVAENRAWVDEVVAATSERWDQQRAWSDPFRRPSYATQPPESARRLVRRLLPERIRPVLRRARARIQRR